MDYVQEELLRQRAVLAALLGGGPERDQREQEERTLPEQEPGPETVRAGGNPWEAIPVERAGRRDSAPKGRGPGTAEPAAGERRRAAGLAEETAEPAGAARRAWAETARGGDREAPAAGETQRRGSGETADWDPLEAAGAEDLAAAGAVWRRDVRSGGGGGVLAEARALSRAVERDARRYDGGFFIY